MSWIDSAVFYHIYPMGFCGAPWQNTGEAPVNRIGKVCDWIPHWKQLHCNAIYFSPLWESSTHGYDTKDYTKLDSRLGTNADFAAVCDALHANGIRVVIDGVFNHVGREFFAFQDLLRNREQSQYRDWFCDVWFGNSNRFGDPFSYACWNGCQELVKLNLRNEAVVSYLESAILGWMDAFHIDGIRFDAADCIDMSFFRRIRHLTKSRNPEFWLMGELIHGDYSRYANPEMLDSATNYECWKGLWSSHNDKNYFEINYAINRQSGDHAIYPNLSLYNFVDNHDVSRLASQLKEPKHLPLAYALLYAMPGVPSIYYGSEFAWKGEKKQGGDENLRPAVEWSDDLPKSSDLCAFLYRLGAAYAELPALHTGKFKTVEVRNQQLAFRRGEGDEAVYCLLNLADQSAQLPLPIGGDGWYDVLTDTPIAAAGSYEIKPFTAVWAAKKRIGHAAPAAEPISVPESVAEPTSEPAAPAAPTEPATKALDAIRERCETASDAEFTAQLRQDMQTLLNELEALQKRVAQLEQGNH